MSKIITPNGQEASASNDINPQQLVSSLLMMQRQNEKLLEMAQKYEAALIEIALLDGSPKKNAITSKTIANRVLPFPVQSGELSLAVYVLTSPTLPTQDGNRVPNPLQIKPEHLERWPNLKGLMRLAPVEKSEEGKQKDKQERILQLEGAIEAMKREMAEIKG